MIFWRSLTWRYPLGQLTRVFFGGSTGAQSIEYADEERVSGGHYQGVTLPTSPHPFVEIA